MPDIVLRAMLDAIVHRGPDGEGVYVDGGIALGMRRLSVIDLAHGWQPLTARGGRVLAFQNGEIYNHGELRATLAREGVRFATASDTEVLAKGYERWGIDELLARIDGMYALAILDRDTRVLHVARDRFGEKPLFYAAAPGRFAYGSDLGILAALPWVDAGLDALSLRRYLALHYVPGDATIYRGVARVLPGERLEIALDAPVPKRVRYYVPPLPATRAISNDALAAIVERAVASRLVAEVPVGVVRCGGLDSAIVAAIAAKHRPGVLTFSMGFHSAEHDESAYARGSVRRIRLLPAVRADARTVRAGETCFRRVARPRRRRLDHRPSAAADAVGLPVAHRHRDSRTARTRRRAFERSVGTRNARMAHRRARSVAARERRGRRDLASR